MANDYCKKCGLCCKNIAVDFSKRVVYRDGVQPLLEDFEKMLICTETKDNISLCTCRFLKDNLCLNPEKPELCKNYPSSPFAFLPDGCGYEGVVFSMHEAVKHKVRKYKEEILHYNVLIQSGIKKDEVKQYQKIIASHQNFIDRYKVYGSDQW